jgi:xanthine dehydrogenase large subunit
MEGMASHALTPAPLPEGEGSRALAAAGRPGDGVPHDSALGHVTGAARYADDLPWLEGELHVVLVGSPVACGRLVGVDASAALEVPGVVAVYTHRDLPGHNSWGPIFADEPVLAGARVEYLGQPVAVVAAETPDAARRGRKLVRVEVVEEPPVLDIDAALERGWFLGPERRIQRGDLDAGFAAASHVLEGTFRCNGQEHFYFESQAAIAVPGEGGEIRVHSSTQNPTEIQKVCAEALGLGQHQVVCEVRRMGGGFGGKETQGTIPAVAAALVAAKTGRAARIVFGKDEDMRNTGKRHPYRCDFRVGCGAEGRITAAELVFHSNGGAFADLSTAVMERTLLHADNAYFLANVSVRGRVCRTNLPPNTAFRGFGGPQAMAAIEQVMERIAAHLGRDALDVRLANLYSDDPSSGRTTTPYGQEVRGNLLPQIFHELERTSCYRPRRDAIETFDAASRTHLRGIAMVPVKFGISFTNKTLNQGNALVHVYTDGTVQVSTGATEMGQGVNTKLAILAAEELGIELAAVKVLSTSTDRNNNTSPTAASASTDLNGTAVVRACETIRARLVELAASHLAAPGPGVEALAPSPQDVVFAGGEVFDQRRPERRMRFAELSQLAHRERVDLGARGFYATPDINFDRETGRGNPFYYFTNGCAVAEVLLDRFTGELKVERLDVLMDAGRMIHHEIERGQVIGGLVQGIGWVTTEELVYGTKGELLSPSPTTYKVPNVTDVPEDFRVAFVDNDRNRHNLRSTKAVGEPPLMLGIAVWAAIYHALSQVRPGAVPELRLPATHEEIVTCLARLEEGRPSRSVRRGATASDLAVRLEPVGNEMARPS